MAVKLDAHSLAPAPQFLHDITELTVSVKYPEAHVVVTVEDEHAEAPVGHLLHKFDDNTYPD